MALLAIAVAMTAGPAMVMAQTAGPAAWQNDLTPVTRADWNYDFAAHLLERILSRISWNSFGPLRSRRFRCCCSSSGADTSISLSNCALANS